MPILILSCAAAGKREREQADPDAEGEGCDLSHVDLPCLSEQPPVPRPVVHLRLPDEELPEPLGLRVGHHLARVALVLDQALVQEEELVRRLAGEAHLVGHDQHRPPLGGEGAHHPQHLVDELRVERAGRLVEEHHLGVHRQRPRDRHPLLLPAGELARVVAALVGDADLGEHRLGLRRRLGLAAAEHVDLRGGDVLEHGHVLPEIELLEDHRELRADAVDLLHVGGRRPAVAGRPCGSARP